MYSNNQLYLVHHGIQGQKWGVRNAEWYPIAAYKEHLKNPKYKNSDGSLNDKGKTVARAMAGIQVARAKANNSYRNLGRNTQKIREYEAMDKADERWMRYQNNGGIEKYNREFDKKHGIVDGKKDGKPFDYMNDPEYNNGFWDYDDDVFSEAWDLTLDEYTYKSKEMTTAMEIINTYLKDDRDVQKIKDDYYGFYKKLAKFA